MKNNYHRRKQNCKAESTLFKVKYCREYNSKNLEIYSAE